MTTQSTTAIKTICAFFAALLLVTLTGCQSMQQPSKADCANDVTQPAISERVIIGAVEKVALPEQKISLNARIDTGATTTSINAQNIKQFERDGKKWVKFEVHDDSGKLATLEKPVSRVVNIKRHGAKDQDRFAVKVKLTLGEINLLTEVTLADRAKFTYPLLIGRNFLQDMAIVDVSKEYTVK